MICTAELADGRKVRYLADPIGEGGMQRCYFVEDKQSVLLLYKENIEEADPNRMRRLRAVLDTHNPTKGPSADYWKEVFCWPTGIVTKPGLGVMTPVIPGNYFFEEGKFKGREKQGIWFTSPKLRGYLPESELGNWLTHLQMCTHMARAVRRFHAMGVAHTDLSAKNVLMDPKRGKVHILGWDMAVVPGLFPPDVLGTPGYIAPEVLATARLNLNDSNRRLPSIHTDLHALAVLVYEILLRRHPLKGGKSHAADAQTDDFLAMGEGALFIEHPDDTSNHPNNPPVVRAEHLGPYLHKVFLQSFVDGLHSPESRPSARQVEDALHLTMDLLIPCGNPSCPEKWFVYLDGKPVACPWCGWRNNRPFPVLDFYCAPRAGIFVQEKHLLAGFDQRPINLWHLQRHVKPVEGISQESVGCLALGHNHGKDEWLLVNKDMDSMASPNGDPVKRGAATVLHDGAEIVLSKERNGRMVRVRMVS